MEKSYQIAAIDVHKKMLAVVVTDAAKVGEFRFERRRFGAGAGDLRLLETWLAQQDVKEVVMESTAQYWKPVWQALEGRYRLELAQAHSNKAPKGRKRDFADAERLARRYIAGELILSFVPNEEQRLWRTMTRTKQQLTRDRVRLQAQLEGFLEETRIKLSSHVSDLLGLSGRRMIGALAQGETDAARIAAMAGDAGTITGRVECSVDDEPVAAPDSQAVSGTFDAAGNADGHAGKEHSRGVAPVPGFCATPGSGTGAGSGFGAADHR